MLLLFQLIADTYQPLATFYGESSGLVAEEAEVAEVAQNFFCLLREWWQQGGGCAAAAAAKGHRLIVGLLPLPHHQHPNNLSSLYLAMHIHIF